MKVLEGLLQGLCGEAAQPQENRQGAGAEPQGVGTIHQAVVQELAKRGGLAGPRVPEDDHLLAGGTEELGQGHLPESLLQGRLAPMLAALVQVGER